MLHTIGSPDATAQPHTASYKACILYRKRPRLSPQPDPQWYKWTARARPNFPTDNLHYCMTSAGSQIPPSAIMQPETALDPYTRFPHRAGRYQNQEEQQESTPYASSSVDEDRNEYELSQFERYDDERQSAGAIDHLLPLETGSTGSEQGEVRPGTHEGSKINALPVAGSRRSAACCRKINAWSTLGQAAIDLCIAGISIYFIAFAVMAILYMGDSEASSTVRNLLTAASFVSLPFATLPQHSPLKCHRALPFGRSCSPLSLVDF